MMINKKYKISKIILIIWCLFIGIGAFYGGVAMLIKPDGSLLQMQSMLPYFKVLPFSDVLFNDYIFSGISLIIVNGISNIVAAIFLLLNKKVGVILGTIFGFTLMLWIIIQFIIFPFNALSTSFFIFGFAQLLTGCICLIYCVRSEFKFDENEYTNTSTNKKELVVFYSRNGYTKKIAYEIANENGAEVLEIKTNEKTGGTSGFWWCGRFAMHRWPMRIENKDMNLNKYDKVTICTPIWVFDISAPIRGFIQNNHAEIKKVDYVFVHFMKCKFKKLSGKLDATFGLRHEKCISVCCRFGKRKCTKEIS